jgi:hypothetical protein
MSSKCSSCNNYKTENHAIYLFSIEALSQSAKDLIRSHLVKLYHGDVDPTNHLTKGPGSAPIEGSFSYTDCIIRT